MQYITGGPVIDHEGSVVGMTLDNSGEHANILDISTILTCIEMWMKFRFANLFSFLHWCYNLAATIYNI